MTMCMTCGGRQAPARGDVPCRCGRFAQPIYDRGYHEGITHAARLFWANVCETRAVEASEEAGSLLWDAGSTPQMTEKSRVWYRAEAERQNAIAAQHRAWASGALSTPIFDERRTR